MFSHLFYSILFLLLSEAPVVAQAVHVRLFEIFHPQSIKIRAAQSSFSRSSPKLGEGHPANLLTVSINKDTLTINRLRIELASGVLQIKDNWRVRSLGSSDTIRIAADAGLVLSPAQALERLYLGQLKIYAFDKELYIINIVSSEAYLADVLAGEIPQAEPSALQAQAVVARTFMIKNQARHIDNGYQFCDLTHCQTYKGENGITAKIRQAVTKTNNEILAYRHRPIDAYYSSTCGGRTADDNGVWGNPNDQPYLASHADSNFCAHSPHYRWRVKVSADSLHQIWQRRLSEPINAITISKKGEDGRVRELALMGHSLHFITGEDFRAVTCRVFGWNTVKSTAFDLRIEKNVYIFTGRGLGHGIGLCQYGAMEMARRGYAYPEILRHYFPGTIIEKNLH